MSTYAKLFGSIVHSTVWGEPLATRVVWVTMLALSDRDGVVEAAVPGLARAANVSVPEVEAALASFLSPDPHSRTPDNEGRRIAKCEGGWKLLNYEKYLFLKSKEEVREKDAQRQARKRRLDKESRTVTDRHAKSPRVTKSPPSGSGSSDLNSTQDQNPPPPAGPDSRELIAVFCEEWEKAYAEKYVVTGADSGRVSAVRKAGVKLEAWRAICARYVSGTDAFLAEKRHPLNMLVHSLNQFTGEPKSRAGPGGAKNLGPRSQRNLSNFAAVLERHRGDENGTSNPGTNGAGDRAAVGVLQVGALGAGNRGVPDGRR